MEKVLLLLCFGGIVPTAVGEQLDVLAFDFYRKFNHYVHLGECTDMSRASQDGKSTHTINCHLKKDGPESFRASEITYESVVEVKSPQDLFNHLGLCDGNSVSRLGLLYNSECVTVDVAKSISYHDSTHTRALFGTYRRGMVSLGGTSGQDGNTSADTGETNFYPKHITYGSVEMIMASLTYKTTSDAKASKQVEFATEKLSDQLETLLKASSNVESVKIIRLSTADREYRTWSFPLPLASEAIQKVKDAESKVEEVKFRVLSKLAMDPYYLNYIMWPFSGPAPGHSDRVSQKTMLWKNVTLCEIQLNQVINLGETVKQMKCVGAMLSSKPCKRLTRRLGRVQRTVEKNIHSARASWHRLTAEEKANLTQKCQKMCVMNEHKMDRTVNKVLFGAVPAPVIGRSRSVQDQWLFKWSRRKDRKGRRGKKRDPTRRKGKTSRRGRKRKAKS